MKRETLYKLHKGIKDCGEFSGVENSEFIYRAGLIYMEIDKRLKLFEESRPKNSDKYNEFNDAHTDLIYKHALKDERGDAVMQGMDVSLVNPFQYKYDLKELMGKYKDAIDEHEKKNNDFKIFLNQEAEDFSFTPIPRKYIPVEMSLDKMIGIVEIVEK